MRHSIEMEKLTLGVCYYPEHWDRALWKDDLQRMKQYGIEVIRLAEFSWALMEPEEGKYDFSFWDEFLALAAEENMKVVFCTPTATPPAWLSEKYPETLNADGDGNLMYHGMRWQHNLTSPKYLEFCEKITRRMAEHFNKYDCIIGWQLDNEVNCETNEYYSKSDHEAFRAFLKERFGTLDNLNEKMGTIFWSQTYTDWDQIHLARRSTVGTGIANPHMQLEQVRFISHSAVHYLALQASIVRETAGDRFITTNGIFGNLDYQKLMESGVDFIMYDSYPNFAYAMDRPDGGEGDLKDRNSSFNLARTRAISPLFGIMEQQAGPGGWNFRIHQASPKPGQLRLWTMQSVAHGADFVSFFRWRTCSFGTEIYWHGLNDYSNRPNRRLEELSLVKADFEAIKDIAGYPYEAAVGILCDYDNEWDGQKDVWHGPLRNFSTDGWFRSLQKKHIPFDFVDFREETNLKDLEKYELLVYPHAAILTKERVEILTQYVANGGKLVMGCRTGYKDIYGRCPMQPMPGEAAELCGVTVEDFTFLAPGEPMEYVNWNKKRIPAPVFNDVLEPAFGGKAEGFFEGNYYDGKPALVTKNTGKGLAIYFGGCFAEETADAFLEALSIQTPAPWLVLPEGCELAKRGDQYFVLNYKAQACEITLKKKVTDRLTGNEIEGTYEVAPYGVLVLL